MAANQFGRDGALAAALERLERVLVGAEVRLRAHQNERALGCRVAHLRDPLGRHVRVRCLRVCREANLLLSSELHSGRGMRRFKDRKTNNKDVCARVAERPQLLVLLLPRRVPQVDVDVVVLVLLNRIEVVKHCWIE